MTFAKGVSSGYFPLGVRLCRLKFSMPLPRIAITAALNFGTNIYRAHAVVCGILSEY